MIALIREVGIFNFIAGVIGIIGTLLAIYFYIQGKKSRRLTCKINPVRTQIVRAGVASRLSVVHDGREIKSDITAVHIAIWNQGREPIRQSDMLRPLIIQTVDHAPILEPSILMVTHNVVGLRLDESKCAMGQLGVSWDILEKDDGGIGPADFPGGAGGDPRASVETPAHPRPGLLSGRPRV
jgi:hypothetical protein